MLPILRAAAKTHGPLGIIHVDAHADVNDLMFGANLLYEMLCVLPGVAYRE